MNLERPPRRHLKADQRLRIAKRFENSGLTPSEFSSRHRVSVSSLHRWLRELRNTPKETPAAIFREVAVCSPLAGSTSQPWAIEFVSPDGMTVRCRERLSVEDLARLLRSRGC
jgi:transposase-like protein